MKKFPFFVLLSLFTTLFMTACEDDTDVPPAENEEEIITDVTLTFTTPGGGTAITATAKDSDGEGPNDLEVLDDIVLANNTTYLLSITMQNAIANESITDEVEEESDEHIFFFSWTDGLFSNPAGDGNIDNRPDAVVYNDQDDAGLPLGLETTWTTGDVGTGDFRILLKHQPDIKSATSTANDGESDVDLTWDLVIE